MTYQSPVADILFSLNHVAGLDAEVRAGLFGDLDSETIASVISEAGRFATDAIAPLNRDRRHRGRALRERPRNDAEGLSRGLQAMGRRRAGRA